MDQLVENDPVDVPAVKLVRNKGGNRLSLQAIPKECFLHREARAQKSYRVQISRKHRLSSGIGNMEEGDR